jgi:adenylate kinase family enzyme
MAVQPRYIVLLGPPASGKGTQAARLRETFGLPHVASGDLFREHLKSKTELGARARVYIDRGELVPDDVTIAMVMERLRRPDCAGGALAFHVPSPRPKPWTRRWPSRGTRSAWCSTYRYPTRCWLNG